MSHLHSRITAVLNVPTVELSPVSSSWGLQVHKITGSEGISALAKSGQATTTDHLTIEAFMLRELKTSSDLPVPQVLYSSPDLLIMEWIDNEGGPRTQSHERHTAELVAALHTTPQPYFGYSRDTIIGALPQPNPETSRWLEFFRDHRLLHMASELLSHGRLSAPLFRRLERFAARLSDYLAEPTHPALLHGDLWGGNVLVKGDRIAGLIDPAIYFGHPEIELAFSTLFGTFGKSFFDTYGALAPLESDFFTIRRDIYNIYPNLVHARLFGPSYLAPIDTLLKKLGF